MPLALLDGLRRYWRPLAMLLLAVLIWLHGAHHEGARVNTAWELRYAKDIATVALARQHASEDARQREQGWAAAFDVTATALIQENQDVAAHRDRLLAAARSGGLRLPAACSSAHLSEATPGAGGGDAAPGGRVPGPAGSAAVEALIGEAARADQIAAQLQACQAVLREERLP